MPEIGVNLIAPLQTEQSLNSPGRPDCRLGSSLVCFSQGVLKSDDLNHAVNSDITPLACHLRHQGVRTTKTWTFSTGTLAQAPYAQLAINFFFQTRKMSEKSRSNVAECEPVAAVLKSRSPSGVSFRGLNCYGFITENQCQLTFLTGLLWLPRSLVRLASKGRHSEKVIILHQMTGLVQPGEMLLVLGRPGSGCSTFLKCLSGNTYGTELEDDSINYGGEHT